MQFEEHREIAKQCRDEAIRHKEEGEHWKKEYNRLLDMYKRKDADIEKLKKEINLFKRNQKSKESEIEPLKKRASHLF